MKRCIAVLMLVLICLGGIAQADGTKGTYAGNWTVVNCNEWVSLRAEPSSSSSRVCKVPLWADVSAYYYNSQWLECYYGNDHGYILRQYLTDRPAKYDGYEKYINSRALGTLKIVNCKNWVTLRQYASTKAPSVARVPLGASVKGYYYNTEFTECTYNGQVGYILNAYLSNGSGSSQSGSSKYLGKKTVINCNEYVTLRQSPSTSGAAVTRVAKGKQVEAYYYNGTFCRCYYNGMEGYILSKYLGDASSSGSSYAKGTSLGSKKVVNCSNWVTLRQNPSTSAATVTRVPKGESVQAYWYNSQFAECYYYGMHGYILLKYLN